MQAGSAICLSATCPVAPTNKLSLNEVGVLGKDRAVDESNPDFRAATRALHQRREFHEFGGEQKRSPELKL
jgi:hypothetical protein